MIGSKSILQYAKTDGGKTAQGGRFARFIRQTTGKITRAVIADQGGSQDVLSWYLQDGTIEAVYVGASPTPLDTMHKLGRGLWPQNPDDPVERWKWSEPTPATWEQVGAYLIDSGTEVAESIITVSLRGTGAKLSQEPSYTFREGDTTVHGGNKPYYGLAQDELAGLVRKFNALPVHRVLWNFGETIGRDDYGRPLYGPEVVGTAITGKLPKKFGDCLHLETYLATGKAKDPGTGELKQVLDPDGKSQLFKYWRIWFQSHQDGQSGVLYPAKPRVPPEMTPELNRQWPAGFLKPRIVKGQMVDGLDRFLEVEAELLARPQTEAP